MDPTASLKNFSRSKKIAMMGRRDHGLRYLLDIPKYESTKGTTSEQQQQALQLFTNIGGNILEKKSRQLKDERNESIKQLQARGENDKNRETKYEEIKNIKWEEPEHQRNALFILQVGKVPCSETQIKQLYQNNEKIEEAGHCSNGKEPEEDILEAFLPSSSEYIPDTSSQNETKKENRQILLTESTSLSPIQKCCPKIEPSTVDLTSQLEELAENGAKNRENEYEEIRETIIPDLEYQNIAFDIQNDKILEKNEKGLGKKLLNENMQTKNKKDMHSKNEIKQKEQKNRRIKRRQIEEVAHCSNELEWEEDIPDPFSPSGSEYIPDTSSEIETEDEDEEIPIAEPIKLSALGECGPKNGASAVDLTFENNATETNAANGLQSNYHADSTIVSYGKFVEISSNKVENFANVRPWTKQTSCPYCFQDVTHFPRHLQRNHKNEGAVQQFSSLSLKDPKRKQLLDAIRRQGNFSANLQNNVIRPVRRTKSQAAYCENSENSKDKYIACQNCLGYFKRIYFGRHKKKCFLKPKTDETGEREDHLSAAQLFQVCSGTYSDFYSTLRLKNEVFKIMRNDDISKSAMQDILICSYAESLLVRHKRPQIKNVISNKMREMGRLLIILKQVTGIQKLFDIMKPQYFDNLVSATKIMSGYDPENHTFKASSLALHMGTNLKQVCAIATKLVLKKSPFLPCKDPENTLKDIKQLGKLIEHHWNSEISSLALKNLNEKKHEKPKLLPVTSDVMKFQKFVMMDAKDACIKLQEGKQIQEDYRRLSECVLALTLLLNRKRVGEIQYLKTETYKNAVQQNHQEEIIKTLSEMEKTLTKDFKRVVTLGKGSRPVAILFSKDMQVFIDTLLSTRNMCVAGTNEYLFANPNTASSCLNGSHILKKLAERSGVSSKSLFTSTRLRKQIATILQVLNLTQNEMEQFANFMGHTSKTHQEYYRLPQDVYQTAKVSKLLLAINSGQDLKGKTLEEIEVSDNYESDSESECKINADENPNILPSSMSANDDLEKAIHKGSTISNATSSETPEEVSHVGQTGYLQVGNKKRKIERIRWTQEQKDVITHFFKGHIKNKQAPRKHEVEELIEKHTILFKDQNWVKIKAFIYNCYK